MHQQQWCNNAGTTAGTIVLNWKTSDVMVNATSVTELR